MKRSICLYGCSVLRTKATEILTKETAQSIIRDLKDTLKEIPQGVGLAANQIGITKRVFLGENNEVFINPEILSEKGGDIMREEGCLSIPMVYGKVRRPRKIRVKYLDENFEPQERLLKEMTARIFMHELDHLNGVLFIDKVHDISKDKVKRACDYLIEKGEPRWGWISDRKKYDIVNHLDVGEAEPTK